MKDADVLFILGSDDAGYTPSKLCPYILARNPLLTVSHEASSLVDVVEEVGAGVSITFSDRSTIEEVSSAIESEWIRKESVPEPNTDWELFEKYTARERTREQCRIFDECAAGAGGQA